MARMALGRNEAEANGIMAKRTAVTMATRVPEKPLTPAQHCTAPMSSNPYKDERMAMLTIIVVYCYRSSIRYIGSTASQKHCIG